MAIQTVKAYINGQPYTLNYNVANGRYEATVNAPATSSFNNNSGHYYPVKIEAIDDAGNITEVTDTDPTFGDSLKLVVKEKVAPTIQITNPTQDAVTTNNQPAITWTITDDDSGVDENTIKITIDSNEYTTGIVTTPIAQGFQCSYTPTVALSDGQHTIKVDGSDNDGNAATQQTVTFKIDTTPPVLQVTAPTEGMVTNTQTITVTGTTNDVTSSPCTVTIKVNGGVDQSAVVQPNGDFSLQVTLRDGANTIEIVSTDSAGKQTTITRNVTVDSGAPVINGITITPNPVDAGQTYIISVDVTD